MRCQQCGKDNLATAKFCAYCGTMIVVVDDAKSPDQVSLAWLQTIMKGLGFVVEMREKDLLARHQTKPNFIMAVNHYIGAITIQSLWVLRKPGWGQRGNLLTAVNKANAQAWVGIWSVSDEGETALVSTHINLTERLSARDIAAFLEIFQETIVKGFEGSGLNAFAAK